MTRTSRGAGRTIGRHAHLPCLPIRLYCSIIAAGGAGGHVRALHRATCVEGAAVSIGVDDPAEGRQHTAGILKIARDGRDNDLLVNEALTLRRLLANVGTEPVPAYIPRMLESFVYRDESGEERQVNAFPLAASESGPLPSDEF